MLWSFFLMEGRAVESSLACQCLYLDFWYWLLLDLLVAWLHFVCALLSVVVIKQWPYISSTWRTPYMMIYRRFIWSSLWDMRFRGRLWECISSRRLFMGWSSLLILGLTNSAQLSLNMVWNVSDHSLFAWHSSVSSIILAVYVNNIVIYGDDSHDINALKEYLSTHSYERFWSLSLLFWDRGRLLSTGSLFVSTEVSVTYWRVIDQLIRRWILLFSLSIIWKML